MKKRTIFTMACALGVGNCVIQRHTNKNGYTSDPTRSEICAVALSAPKEDLGTAYNAKAHNYYALTAIFQGLIKGSFLDETYVKSFWNLNRYLTQEAEGDAADIIKIRPYVAKRCMSDYETEKLSERELLGLSPK